MTAGKVQINIGHLVPMEAQKDSEGYIMPIPHHGSAAFGTILGRQVKAGVHLIIHEELAMTALRTTIMGLQRIDLGDIQHGGHEGRANTATGANQIATVQRMLDQLVRDEIEHRKAMSNNRVQLHLQAILHDLRQLIPIPRMRLSIGEIFNCVLRAGDGGRIELITVWNWLNAVHQVRYLIGIGDDDLIGSLLTQISKLLQHLLSCVQIERRLQLRILVVLRRLQNGAQLGILWIEEMHIACGHDQLAHALAQLINATIMFLEILWGAVALANEEHIIARRLNF